MNSVKSVLDDFESLSDNVNKEILLFGDSRLDDNKNKFILEATLNYIRTSEGFSGSLFEQKYFFSLHFDNLCSQYFHLK